MNIAIILQNIKDPVNYSKAFLQQLKTLYPELSITVFSDKDTAIFQDVANSETINYLQAFKDSISTPPITPNTQINIGKQIDVSKKLGRKTTAQTLIHEHLQLLDFYHSHFSDRKFDLLLVWNGITHSFQTAGVEIARKLDVPVIFLERGLIPGSIFYDAEGVNAESSIGKNPTWQQQSQLINYPDLFAAIKTLVIETGGGLVSDAVQTSAIPLKDYVFFPLQRDTDSNMLFNSPYVKNMFSILSALNGWITQYQADLPVLVRPHPEDPQKHYTKQLAFDNLTIQSDGGLLETIEKAAVIMTVNSTVGFTSLILDKPVIALGKSIYNNRALCIEPPNMDTLKTILLNQKIPPVTGSVIKQRHDFVSKVIANSHISFNHPTLLETQTRAFRRQIERLLNAKQGAC